jgi:hypothetical protein
MICIFCDTENSATSIEHIVSESLGNKDYIIEKGKVCDECNGKFSKFENTALSNSIFVMERARFAIETKKGKSAKGKIGELEILGNENFKKGLVTFKGEKIIFNNFNPETNIGSLTVATFDKSEVSVSKLLLKIGLESMYSSRRDVFKKYDFKDLKCFLTSKTNIDWPFVNTNYEFKKFQSVPRYTDKYKLKKRRCELKYLEFDDNILLFKFKYGGVYMTINLLNRNLDWIELLPNEEKKYAFPEHYRNKKK